VAATHPRLLGPTLAQIQQLGPHFKLSCVLSLREANNSLCLPAAWLNLLAGSNSPVNSPALIQAPRTTILSLDLDFHPSLWPTLAMLNWLFKQFRVIHVMTAESLAPRRTIMTTFTIDTDNNITAFGSAEEAAAATTTPFDSFASQKELAALAAAWPAERPVAIWNSLPGVAQVEAFQEQQRRHQQHLGAHPGTRGACEARGTAREAESG